MLQQKHKTGLILTFIISVVLIGVALLFFVYRQRITDQITVWEFHPSSLISGLVDRAGMNSDGKFYYLASQPILDGTQNFNTECERTEMVTSILGCYVNNRIYVYDVTDPELDGIREVTATHETLHAIYARLSESERERVDSMIEAQYKKLANNQDYAELLAYYAKAEPGQRDNELHSIIGTEVANLDPDLEAYYSQYFTNRQEVVQLNAAYSSKFKALKDRADNLSAQLDALSAKISSESNQYNVDVQALNSDIAAFNARASSGQFTSQSQFYSQRANLLARASQLDAARTEINNEINQYKSLIAEYNSIASQSKKLYNVIDSTLAPSPSNKL